MRALVLVVACGCGRIGFEATGVTAAVDRTCTPGQLCVVGCTTAPSCHVDCNGAVACIVECPAADCVVDDCGDDCSVTCNGLREASVVDGIATCP